MNEPSLRLDDIERIKRVKYRYARALDTRDIDILASLFTEDAEIDYRGGTYRFTVSGRDAIVAAMRAAFPPHLVGSHTMHMPLIDVHDDGTADGRWSLLDYALDLANGNKTTIGAAYYTDRYICQDGCWLIARSEYDRVYERVYFDADPGLTTFFHAMRP